MTHKRKMPPAHTLEEAANSDNSLEGYAAMNADLHSEIARLAYQLYEDRGRQDGFHHQDWLKAEEEVRRRSDAAGEEAHESESSSRE